MPSQDRAIDKRHRLLESAARVIHRRGYARTTLADIASEARLPSGSLYYYFRSKEAIVAAIIAERLRDLEQRMAQWEGHPDPRARLCALVQVWVDDADTDARYGCPIGSLCYELAKTCEGGQNRAAEPLRLLLQWSAEQFAALGMERPQADDHALHLLAALQGISLIGNGFGDPQLILRETGRLQRWLQAL